MDTLSIHRPLQLKQCDGYWQGEFEAMASPCQLLIGTAEKDLAAQLLNIAAREAWRIEQKYSRYRKDGIVAQINKANDQGVLLDEETASLMDFAYQCYDLSDGLFDITSGVLRKVWRFDGSDKLPTRNAVSELMPFVGLDKCRWEDRHFWLAPGMEIDFGGIGKEYAVDKSLLLMTRRADLPILVNYGGDIVTNRPRVATTPWRVGIEKPSTNDDPLTHLDIYEGALATSGDANRFLKKDGVRYGHVLNPKTGWPVENAPCSVTVAQATCTQAGILSTLAILQGKGAEEFLDSQEVKHWVVR